MILNSWGFILTKCKEKPNSALEVTGLMSLSEGLRVRIFVLKRKSHVANN